MATKTSVYLGPEEQRLLRELERRTGRRRSQLIRDGIHALANQLPERPKPKSLGIGTFKLTDANRRWNADELARARGLTP